MQALGQVGKLVSRGKAIRGISRGSAGGRGIAGTAGRGTTGTAGRATTGTAGRGTTGTAGRGKTGDGGSTVGETPSAAGREEGDPENDAINDALEQSTETPGADLRSKLIEVGLDPVKWLPRFTETLKITNLNALKHITDHEIRKITLRNDLPWEKEALRKMRLVGSEEQEGTAEQSSQRDQIDAQIAAMKEKLKEIETETASAMNEALNTVKAQMVLPTDFGDVKMSSKEKLEYIKGITKVTGAKAIPRKQWSAAETVMNASGGLACQGMFLARGELFQDRMNVLSVPSNLQFSGPIMSDKTDIEEFDSQEDTDTFTKTMEKHGNTVAANVKAGFWGFGMEATSSTSWGGEEDNSSRERKTEGYVSSVTTLDVPTVSVYLAENDIKLTREAIEFLQYIETQLENQTLFEEFFEKYGSHVNTGIIQFGGKLISKAECTFSDENTRDEKRTATSLKSSNYIGGSYGSFSAGVSVDVEKNESNNDGKNIVKTESRTTIRLIKVGGPQEMDDPATWKHGLVSNPSTWRVIDRGERIKPIWEVLLRHHIDEFDDVISLVGQMKEAWKSITGLDIKAKLGVMMTQAAVRRVLNDVNSWLEDDSKILFQRNLQILSDYRKAHKDILSEAQWHKYIIQDESVQLYITDAVEYVENTPGYLDKISICQNIRNILSPIHNIQLKDFANIYRIRCATRYYKQEIEETYADFLSQILEKNIVGNLGDELQESLNPKFDSHTNAQFYIFTELLINKKIEDYKNCIFNYELFMKGWIDKIIRKQFEGKVGEQQNLNSVKDLAIECLAQYISDFANVAILTSKQLTSKLKNENPVKKTEEGSLNPDENEKHVPTTSEKKSSDESHEQAADNAKTPENQATNGSDITGRQVVDNLKRNEKQATDNLDPTAKTDSTNTTEKQTTDSTDTTAKQAAESTHKTEKQAADTTNTTAKQLTDTSEKQAADGKDKAGRQAAENTDTTEHKSEKAEKPNTETDNETAKQPLKNNVLMLSTFYQAFCNNLIEGQFVSVLNRNSLQYYQDAPIENIDQFVESIINWLYTVGRKRIIDHINTWTYDNISLEGGDGDNDDFFANRESNRSYMFLLMEFIDNKLRGCNSVCPFCFAPCDNHEDGYHKTYRHRPMGISGLRLLTDQSLLDEGSERFDELIQETCPQMIVEHADYAFNPTNNNITRTLNSSHNYVNTLPLKDYQKLHPDWEISPEGQLQPTYWYWLLGNFWNEFEKESIGKRPRGESLESHSRVISGKAELYKTLSVGELRKSLKDYFGVMKKH